MTNKEAISQLEEINKEPHIYSEAVDMAISALQEQDSKTRRICKTCKHYPAKMDKWPCVDCDMREPADRWESQDVPDTNIGDMISRRAAIYAIEAKQMPIMRSKGIDDQFYFKGLGEAHLIIEELPSAEPERKPGKWIGVTRIEKWGKEEGLTGFPPEVDEFPSCTITYVDATEPDEVDAVKCSECGEIFDFSEALYFCPNCGAIMEGNTDG